MGFYKGRRAKNAAFCRIGRGPRGAGTLEHGPGARVYWDIFCNVIDNYGDIGVTWRLARQLVSEYRQRVRLWVDDLHTFGRVWPQVDPHAAVQTCAGVEIRMWRTPFMDVEPAQVVVEAFGCVLPNNYLAAMARRSPPPVWINLEYLSAEAWVADHHGLPSPHPRLPLVKHFFFPGYAAGTGGLAVERDLAARRDAFLRTKLERFWANLGLAPAQPDEWRVSLFAYENAALPELMDAWAGGTERVVCLVPEGRIGLQLERWLGGAKLAVGDVRARGRLQVRSLPFTDQDSYDRLLWACDLNFVRGEDSCVRAQYAARPLVWQAYPQAEAAHRAKLEALLALYQASLDGRTREAVAGLWRAWNQVPDAPAVALAWDAWRTRRAAIAAHARNWPQQLAAAGRLGEKLVEFAGNRLK